MARALRRPAPMRFLFALVLLASACGESATDTDTKDSGLPDAVAEAGPCEPFGNWTWSFQVEAGAPLTDHVTLAPAPDGGEGVSVTFQDRTLNQDQCSPSDAGADAAPELVVAPGTLDLTTCSLSVGYQESWCQSGEQQFLSWDIALTFAGSSGQGTAKKVSGWTMQKYETSYTVTATKAGQ